MEQFVSQHEVEAKEKDLFGVSPNGCARNRDPPTMTHATGEESSAAAREISSPIRHARK